jgi:hypothetical protein
VAIEFSATARRVGIASAAGVVLLGAAYAVTLAVGLGALESPQQPIADPMFSILELLIIALMPAMVSLMVAVHAWAPAHVKVLSLIAVVFMGLLAGLTCSVHFAILTLSHQPALVGQAWLPLLLSFKWPSLAYALDILGWDVFFALSMLFAAPVFGGSRLGQWIRVLMSASGVLALAGLSGLVSADMRLRNLGIVGYLGVFLVVAGLLASLFHRSKPVA